MDKSEMTMALFRADGSRHLGLGNVMRCLAFSQGLRRTGGNIIFVIRDYDEKVVELIQHYGCIVEKIPKNCSLDEDLSLTSELARRYKASLIVTDLSNPDTQERVDEYREYLHGLKDTGKFLITIDDLNVMPFPSDIVINPNYGAEDMNYDLGGSTKFLLGTNYFIFRQEFIEAAQIERDVKRDVHKILVTMGGTYVGNRALKATRALGRLPSAGNLNLHVILGVGYTDSEKRNIESGLKDFAGSYELVPESNSMAKLMLWSDIAIISGGLTKYEAAVTGTPSIMISGDSYQAELAGRFARAGFALYLGSADEVEEDSIINAVTKLMANGLLRVEMSKRGRKAFDGRGIERIISEIPAEVLL